MKCNSYAVIFLHIPDAFNAHNHFFIFGEFSVNTVFTTLFCFDFTVQLHGSVLILVAVVIHVNVIHALVSFQVDVLPERKRLCACKVEIIRAFVPA